MVTLYFSGLDQRHTYRTCSFMDQDLEVCFEVLSGLVAAGWRLNRVYLIDCCGKRTYLPVAAFDGLSMRKQLYALQAEWEEILAQL